MFTTMLSGTSSEKKTRSEPNEATPPDEVLFGCSQAMAGVRQRAKKICSTGVQVLLCGDAGTGKEVLARWIHANSTYSDGQFVSVNCAAIPGELLESELFGYEKGAFTGAYASKPGRFELAHNGTLFLDEIADLDLNLQSKLLHFLQDGHFSRIGGEEERTVNTRVICATSKDLEQNIAMGKFRADLFYRINVVQLRLPRLRERCEDIPILAEHFRTYYMKQFAREAEPLRVEMLNYLRTRNWPGNVRELANGIARYVLIGPEAAIAEEQPPRGMLSSTGLPREAASVPLKRITSEAIREMERNVILEALRANRWNRRKTAQALKISYRALIYKIRDAGLSQRGPQTASVDGDTQPRSGNKAAFPAD